MAGHAKADVSAAKRQVRVGIPTEVKDRERRVVLTPSAVATVVAAGHEVLIQAGAGDGAGFADAAYAAVGATIVETAEQVWASDVVVKVKEPQPEEFPYFRPDLRLFAYLHLAAEPRLTQALVDAGTHAYAFETLTEGRALPLLSPMSEIAGRAAAILGAAQLSASGGGSGTLAGGAAGVPPAKTVVIGLGVAGTMAARGLRGLGAHVTGVDVNLARLLEVRMDGVVDATQVSEPEAVGAHVAQADIVVGAALVPGARAPTVVSAEQVAAMRPGSVVVDLAIDQGGCIETARPTSLSQPTYVEHGVIHYCVTNVPGQFPRTASAALSAAVAPRVIALAAHVANHDEPAGETTALAGACNVAGGAIVHPAIASRQP